jgi:MFS family permease
MGGRNGLLSIVSLLVTLGSGKLLSSVSFPLGYQIVFGIGFFGAAMSSFHLYWLKKTGSTPVETKKWTFKEILSSMLPRINLATADQKYMRVLFLLFCFHVSQWLVIPVIPLYTVNILKLNDFQISVGNSAFNLVVFIGSFFLGSVTSRFGNHKVAGFSMMGLGIFPMLMSLAREYNMFVVTNLVGGAFWAILAGALFNYLADHVPEKDRSTSISWYILVSNGSILIGSLLGPKIAGWMGFTEALFIFGVLRVVSGLAVLKWG